MKIFSGILFAVLNFHSLSMLVIMPLGNFPLSEVSVNPDTLLQTGWYFLVDSGKGIARKIKNENTVYFLDPDPIIKAENIKSLKIKKNYSGNFLISISFDAEGTQAWSIATEKSIGEKLGFILDDQLISCPVVMAQITGGHSELSGMFETKKEWKDLREKILKQIH